MGNGEWGMRKSLLSSSGSEIFSLGLPRSLRFPSLEGLGVGSALQPPSANQGVSW
ncbi:MAG: hypothetical protein F6K47_15025 [Symploca sp. SIO2E6]|nr:hypothetical protein [Symploca sp. SIO2E6]